MDRIRNAFARKKEYNSYTTETRTTPSTNGLNLFSLTTLGIAPAIGIGVYVVTGVLAKEVSGPSVVISFVIAGIAAALSGLCYAELATRMPKAGSAYTYSYVAVGEFLAFIVGWSLILEYIIGAVSIAKCITMYIDYFADDVLKDTFEDIAPVNAKFLGEYYDFCTFGISMLVALTVAFGIKTKSIVRVLVTVVNVVVIVVIIIAGAVKSDSNSWSLAANITNPSINNGQFFPFEASGVLSGAAICFFAFIGFETIADKGNRAKNPKQFIPIAIIASLFTVLLCYIAISVVLTMMIEFYNLDPNAPILHAFDAVDLGPIKWIAGIGGLFCLVTTLFELAFALKKISSRMASDGIIFNYITKSNGCFSMYRLLGMLAVGLLTGFFGGLFNLFQLVNMMSIATLFIYGNVAACVLVLRYGDTSQNSKSKTDFNISNGNGKMTARNQNCCSSMFNIGGPKEPSTTSQKVSSIYILTYCILSTVVALLFFFLIDVNDMVFEDHSIILLAIFGGAALIVMVLLAIQPTTTENLSFKVPLLPLIPCLSILINFYLMLMLEGQTWIRFGAWILLGIPLYLLLGPKPIEKTTEEYKPEDLHVQTYGLDITSHTRQYYEDEKSEENPSSEDSGIVISARSMEELQHNTKEESIQNAATDFHIRKKSASSVDVVLAELDNVISNEDHHSINEIGSSRKTSLDSVSDCGPVDVAVVALVHSEDIRTPKPEEHKPIFVDVNEKDDNNNVESGPTEVIPETRDGDQLSPEEDTSSTASDTPTVVFVSENTEDDSKENDSTISSSPVRFVEEVSGDDKVLTEDNILTPIFIDNDDRKDANAEDSDDKLLIEENDDSIPSSNSSSAVSLKLRDEDADYETDIDDIPDPPVIPPPPPPPLEGFISYKPVQIPRISIKSNKMAKLKEKAPKTPAIDYSRGSSMTDLTNVEEPDDDNVKVGSKGHQDIRSKLTELFQKNFGPPPAKLTKPMEYEREEINGSQTLKPVMSKVISEIVKNAPEDETKPPEEPGVDDRPLERASDIRHKLNDIFKSGRKPNSPKEYVRRTAGKEVVVGNPGGNNTAPVDSLQSHKRNMFNTLNSIKLRKVESFNKDT